MTAPAQTALQLQRPLPDNMLRVVARGRKSDGDEEKALDIEIEATLLSSRVTDL